MAGHAAHLAILNRSSEFEPAARADAPRVRYRRDCSSPCSYGTGGSSMVGPTLVCVTVTPTAKVTADNRPTRRSLYFTLK